MAERIVHAPILALEAHLHTLRQLDACDGVLHTGGYRRQVAVFRIHKNICDAFETDMVDFHLAIGAARGDQCPQIDRGLAPRRGHRHAQDILQPAVHILGKLDAHEVLVAGLGIDPEIAIHRHAGIQGHHDLENDILRREALLGSLYPIDIQHEIGSVVALLDSHINRAWNRSHRVPHAARYGQKILGASALDLNIDRRGCPLIEGRGYHSARVEFRP